MANCHSLFQNFHDGICIGKTKKDRMKNSKTALRSRIRKWFSENQSGYVPKFYIQGSDKMKSGIRTKEDICDLDDGVYFFRKPDVSSTTLQEWVWKAVNGYTDTTPEHRKKCIRSIFENDYEIDHPVYYKIDGKNYQIAVKGGEFEDSDPKAMIDWFVSKKDKSGKLIRVVMYLKAWCDNIRNKMPSGLSMTILASNAKDKIVLNDRDDITLRDILKEIKKALEVKFECIVPVVPGDNLFGSYDNSRKSNFLNALNEFIDDADNALKEENELKASKLWRKHLGERFPFGKDEKQQASKIISSTIVGAGSSNPWANE